MSGFRWVPAPGFDARLDAAVLDAVEVGANVLLSEANRTVPVDTGVLRASGQADHERTASGAEAVVSYATPYAVRQHEDLSLRHAPGKRGRWLERALAENEAAILQVIADELDTRLR